MDITKTDRLFFEGVSVQAGDAYFGNPYQLPYEQYGLEFLDRDGHEFDAVEHVVILGYN